MPREGSNAWYRAYVDRLYLDKANRDNYLYRFSASKIGLSGGLVVPALETLDGVDLSVHAANLAAHTRSYHQLLLLNVPQFVGSIHPGSATNTIVVNTLYAAPFVVARNMTISGISIEVTTLASGASARLGIYSDNDSLYPGSLVKDCGTVSVASTGIKTISVTQALTKGIYWLVLVSNGGPIVRAEQYQDFTLGFTSTDFSKLAIGYSVAFTYDTLPTTFPADGAYIEGATFVPVFALTPASMD